MARCHKRKDYMDENEKSFIENEVNTMGPGEDAPEEDL